MASEGGLCPSSQAPALLVVVSESALHRLANPRSQMAVMYNLVSVSQLSSQGWLATAACRGGLIGRGELVEPIGPVESGLPDG